MTETGKSFEMTGTGKSFEIYKRIGDFMEMHVLVQKCLQMG